MDRGATANMNFRPHGCPVAHIVLGKLVGSQRTP